MILEVVFLRLLIMNKVGKKFEREALTEKLFSKLLFKSYVEVVMLVLGWLL